MSGLILHILEHLCFDDLCAELLGDGLKFVFSPDIIFLWLAGLKVPTN